MIAFVIQVFDCESPNRDERVARFVPNSRLEERRGRHAKGLEQSELVQLLHSRIAHFGCKIELRLVVLDVQQFPYFN